MTEVAGEFADYDGLIEALRERAAAIGLSYRIVEELAGMAEGAVGKYLSDVRVKRLTIESLVRLGRVLAVRGVLVVDPAALSVRGSLVVDPELVAEMAPLWEKRDASKAHARRLAPISYRKLKRVAQELGRRGGEVRMEMMTAAMRRRFARAGARARWRKP
jgi:hypothetical protein